MAIAQTFFIEVEHRTFWPTKLVLFCKYFVIDRIHPNQKGYWKLVTSRKLVE